MASDPAIESLKLLMQAVEESVGATRNLIDAYKELAGRDVELADNLIDLQSQITFVASRSRLLLNMKAATLTTKCLRCGTLFAREPGPELCGPCWTELGRPERYLAPVTTS